MEMGRGDVSTFEFATTTMRDTSGYVKRARAKLRLTQAEFAEALGLERRSVVRYENGGPLPLQTRLAIMQLVGSKERRRIRKFLKKLSTNGHTKK